MLESAWNNDILKVISWGPNGRTIQVHDCDKLESEVMPRYFKAKKFDSFRKAVHDYGFRVKTTGKSALFSHELFCQQSTELCKNKE